MCTSSAILLPATGAGKFDVLAAIAINDESTKMIVTIDDVAYGTKEDPLVICRDELENKFVSGGEDIDWYRFGSKKMFEIELAQGEHTMKVELVSAGCNFDGIVFESEPEDFNLTVPGKIEGEHYDSGYGKYLWKDGKTNGNYKQYRLDKGVAISRSTHNGGDTSSPGYENGDEIIHLGNSQSGNYLTYTFDCQIAGNYTFSTCVSTVGTHKYYITIDDVDYGSKDKPFEVNTQEDNKWQVYKEFEMPDVQIPLTEGKHKMVYHLVTGSCNIDYFRLFTDDVTGIEDIVVDAEDEGLWYTIDGIAHDKPVKGTVNIHNGKRIFVK